MDWKSKEFAAQYNPAEAMTGPFGRHLLVQCGLDRADGSEDVVLLDNATGTGIVLAHLYDVLPPAAQARLTVVAGDISPSMVESVKARVERNGWQGITAQVVDATNMGLPSDHFTHVITNFALVGIPDPHAALSEVHRVLRPSGVAAFTIWKSVGWFDITRAAVEGILGAPRFPTFNEFSKAFLKDRAPGDDEAQWTTPAYFEAQIRKAGFDAVKTVLHANRTRYASAEEYVKVFTMITNLVMANAWTAEERAAVEPRLGPALLEELKRRFGDGEIVLDWEAYCIAARVPATKA